MTLEKFLRVRIFVTAFVLIGIWSLLIWEYFHGGVQSHHLLQREDLPAFSNWWGGFLLPILTWFLLYRIGTRIGEDAADFKALKNILYAFIGALLFGILLSLFFTLGYTNVPFYMILSLFFIALLVPIYRAESFLGFVLGMTITFGGVLPIIVISIFSLIGALLFLILRPGILFVTSKVGGLLTTNNSNKSSFDK